MTDKTDTDVLDALIEGLGLSMQCTDCGVTSLTQNEADEILSALKRAKELETESFALAAGQCIVTGGLVGDEGGSPFCTVRATLGKERKRVVELEAALAKIEEVKKFQDDAIQCAVHLALSLHEIRDTITTELDPSVNEHHKNEAYRLAAKMNDSQLLRDIETLGDA